MEKWLDGLDTAHYCRHGHRGFYWKGDMSYEEALAWASRDEAFKATIYAMNTLLIHKGIYSKEEFEGLFVEWIGKEQKRRERELKPTRATLSA